MSRQRCRATGIGWLQFSLLRSWLLPSGRTRRRGTIDLSVAWGTIILADWRGDAGSGLRLWTRAISPRTNIAHGDFRGGFGYGYGWYGPVFWPHAYDDVFNDILWGYGLGGPFWDYGYGDIYAGLFTPLGTSDLAGAPPGEQAQDTVSPPVGRSAESRQASPSSEFSQMCGDGSKEIASWPIDQSSRVPSQPPNSAPGSMNLPMRRSKLPRRSKKPVQSRLFSHRPDDWKRCRSGSREWHKRSPSLAGRSNASTAL